MKWLVVGLGNPEGKYFQTWHNLGFLAVERLAHLMATSGDTSTATALPPAGVPRPAPWKKKGNQLLAKMNNATLLLKPLTYMNRSGEAVVAVVRKHKIPPERVIVLVDDLALDKGRIKITLGGGTGGHNGLKSVTGLLGTANYYKIRIGIKPKIEPHSTSDYVLKRIPDDERELICDTLDCAAEAALELLNGAPFDRVQTKYNTFKE